MPVCRLGEQMNKDFNAKDQTAGALTIYISVMGWAEAQQSEQQDTILALRHENKRPKRKIWNLRRERGENNMAYLPEERETVIRYDELDNFQYF